MATLLLALGGTILAAQELRVTCQPDQASLLFGEPIYATYRVENISKRTIYVCAYKDKGGSASFIGWKAEAFGPIGKVPHNWEAFGSKPRLPLLPGESIQVRQPLPITDTRVDQLPVGVYSLVFEVSYSALAAGSGWESKARCESSFNVKEPEGQDREWIQALKDAVQAAKADTTRVRPALRWGEVLDGSLKNIEQTLLSSYPTSTYAGYALLSAGQCIPDPRVFLVNFLEHDKTADRWPQTTGQMAEEKKRDLEDTQKRVAQLAGYLKARPDFARADALKLELGGRLAMLGRYDEARALCDEITLNNADSQEAKKARMLTDFLVQKGYIKANKESPSTKPDATEEPRTERKLQ